MGGGRRSRGYPRDASLARDEKGEQAFSFSGALSHGLLHPHDPVNASRGGTAYNPAVAGFWNQYDHK